jgi:hypothetical protein
MIYTAVQHTIWTIRWFRPDDGLSSEDAAPAAPLLAITIPDAAADRDIGP